MVTQSPGEPSRQIAKISLAVASDNPVSLAIDRTWTAMGMLRGHACSAARVSSSVANFVAGFTVLFYPTEAELRRDDWRDELAVQRPPSGFVPDASMYPIEIS
jgi:hypothetical protein